MIKNRIKESIEVKEKILNSNNILLEIEKLIQLTVQTYENGGKLMFAGNGGSAADAQHIAAELVSRFYLERKGYPALALTVDSSIMTGIGNDYSFDNLFDRQIEAYGKKGDIFVGISTSGNSQNIIQGVKKAKSMGIYTVGLLGKDGGMIKDIVDLAIVVPSFDTPRIQESHIMIGHIMCEFVEQQLADKLV